MLNKLVLSLFLAFVVGDCIQLTSGVFKGEYWKILNVNTDGTFDIWQKSNDPDHNPTWIIREVRGTYLRYADKRQCK